MTVATKTIDGTNSHNVLRGEANARNTISGRSGNDTLHGANLDDALYGGNGNDVIFGYDGNDTIDGGNNHDSLDGGAGDDSIKGGAGNDTLFGAAGNDTLIGGSGNFADTLDGGAGNDFADYSAALMGIRATIAEPKSDASKVVSAEFGTDTLYRIEGVIGGAAGDVMSVTGSNSRSEGYVLNGRGGNDTLSGSAASDTILGGDGADLLNGGWGADVIEGGAGNDTILGGTGSFHDTMSGGAGADVFYTPSNRSSTERAAEDFAANYTITDFNIDEDRLVTGEWYKDGKIEFKPREDAVFVDMIKRLYETDLSKGDEVEFYAKGADGLYSVLQYTAEGSNWGELSIFDNMTSAHLKEMGIRIGWL